MFFFWFFFSLSVMIITTQSITTWQVFIGFSQIENKFVKKFQALSFCMIISLLIIGSVFIGETWIALLGAALEVLINFYYYAKDFFEAGFKSFTGNKEEVKKKRRQSIIRFWRRYWIRFVFGIIVPGGIFLCSHLMLMFK